MAAVTDVASTPVSDAGATTAKQLDDKFVAAWNAHSVEQLLSLMTDDVIYDDSSWPTQMHGPTEVRPFLESTWRAVPDLAFVHEDVVYVDPSGTKTARCWTGTATHTGRWDPPGLTPTGRRLQFHGTAFLESRDGKLSRIRVVYDVANIMEQLGILPKAGSAGERLIVFATNLRGLVRRR